MSKTNSLKEQLRRNAVALISLVIAVTSLGYNTWRNEASEHNRNQRLVAIELLVQLRDMHETLLNLEYGKESEVRPNVRKGWSLARSIQDLSMIAEGELKQAGDELLTVWGARFDELRRSDEDAKEAIEDEIETMRAATHALLRSLD